MYWRGNNMGQTLNQRRGFLEGLSESRGLLVGTDIKKRHQRI